MAYQSTTCARFVDLRGPVFIILDGRRYKREIADASPPAALLNHLVAKDAAAAAHTLSEVVKSTPHGSGDGGRPHCRCFGRFRPGTGSPAVPSALALYLSRKDEVPNPKRGPSPAWPPGAPVSSKGPRSAVARGWHAQKKRFATSSTSDGLMHGQRAKLLEAVPTAGAARHRSGARAWTG